MVSYRTFSDGESAQTATARGSRYLAPLAALWATLLVAAILFVSNTPSARTELLTLIPAQVLAFKPYEPERNVFENFDEDGPGLDYAWKHDYDLASEADFSQINIASGANEAVTEGVPDPYFVSHGLTVPEAVYTRPPPYETHVVELGEPTLGRPFKEYVPEEGVIGKAYVDTPFDKTLNSVPEENPARDWFPVEE